MDLRTLFKCLRIPIVERRFVLTTRPFSGPQVRRNGNVLGILIGGCRLFVSAGIFELGGGICGVAPKSTAPPYRPGPIASVGGAGISVGGTSMLAFSVEPRKKVAGTDGLHWADDVCSGSRPWTLDRWTPFRRALRGDDVATSICQLEISSLPGCSNFSPPSANPPVVSLEKKLCCNWIQLASLGLWQLSFVSFSVFGMEEPLISGIAARFIGLLIGFNVICIALFILKMVLDEYAMLLPRLFKKRALWGVAPYRLFFLGDLILGRDRRSLSEDLEVLAQKGRLL